MRTLTIILILLLSGCGKPWKPVLDPRAAKEPREIVRDTLECERLIVEADEYHGKPARERSDWTILGFRTCWTDCGRGTIPPDYNPMYTCLTGRGHAILNWK
jgi:hypothetical protein